MRACIRACVHAYMARKVTTAARMGTLWPAGSNLNGHVHAGPAPNPSDVRWELLEVPKVQRSRAILMGYLAMVPLMLIGSALIMISSYFAVLLRPNFPTFTTCPFGEETCDLTFQIVITNFGNWLWTTALVLIGFQVKACACTCTC